MIESKQSRKLLFLDCPAGRSSRSFEPRTGKSMQIPWIGDIPRNRGIHATGGPGSGKSTLLAKGIAYVDFLFGIPLLIIDPQGGTIDRFLDKVLALPPDAFDVIKDKIVYTDMSGRSGY